MALRNQIFNAPVAPTYQPAPGIERRLAQTGQILSGAIKDRNQFIKEQEQQFSNLYNNLGEIEGQLQQNYAGIMQEAVDSTKNFMKDWYKSGKRSTDPEFQMRLGEMTGRIKSGMSNAENIRKQISENIKLLKDNPYIDSYGRNQAANEMLQMAQNPDVLISRNPIDFSQVTQKYITPSLVFKEAYQNIPSMGETESVFNDEKGNELSTTIILNDLISSENPFDEQGRPNLQLSPERASEILRNNPMLTQMTERIRAEKYADLPVDIGRTAALRDGFMEVAPLGQKTRVRRTKDQIAKEEANIRRLEGAYRKDMAKADLDIANAQRRAVQETQGEEVREMFDEFLQGYLNNDNTVLKNFEKLNKIKDVQWSVPQEEEAKITDLNWVLDDNKWKDEKSRDLRIGLYEQYGVEPPSALGGFGKWETLDEGSRQKLAQAIRSQIDKSKKGITFMRKGPNAQGQEQWIQEFIPIAGINDTQAAFNAIMSTTGVKKFQPKGEIPQQPTGGASRFNPK